MAKLAIASMAIGDEFRRLSEISFPTFRAYANRIGAEFWEIPGGQFPGSHTHWEKLAIGKLTEIFDRVCWIDCDAVVSPHATSIFDQVPEEAFGAFDEGKVINRTEAIAQGIELYGAAVHATRYFNAGVMVFGRAHAKVFTPPTLLVDGGMPEQTYVNAQVARLGLPFHDLGPLWNSFSMYYSPEQRRHLNIIHYAGWPKTPHWVAAMSLEMETDLARWKGWGKEI